MSTAECNCGSHKLAPLYHKPDCPEANAVQRAPTEWEQKRRKAIPTEVPFESLPTPLEGVVRSPGAPVNREKFTLEIEREEDGRWIADIIDIPGAMAYGATFMDAIERAIAIAAALERGKEAKS